MINSKFKNKQKNKNKRKTTLLFSLNLLKAKLIKKNKIIIIIRNKIN